MSRRTESLTENSSLPNPSKKWMEWGTKEKGLRYYDSEAGENVKIKAPLKFIYLDERSTIIGFDGESNSRIYSNDVKNVTTTPFRVSSKRGLLVSGFLKDIKEKLNSLDASNAARIYCIINDELVNFTLKRSFRGKWIDFVKAHPKAKPDWANRYIEIVGTEERKAGGVKFNVPIFAFGDELTDGDKEIADQAYDELFEYFESKNGSSGQNEQEDLGGDDELAPEEPKPVAVGEGEDALPF